MANDESRAIADAMKVGAETARQRDRVEGLDGKGWVAAIRANPQRSLPGGAGHLVVEYLTERIESAEELYRAASDRSSA